MKKKIEIFVLSWKNTKKEYFSNKENVFWQQTKTLNSLKPNCYRVSFSRRSPETNLNGSDLDGFFCHLFFTTQTQNTKNIKTKAISCTHKSVINSSGYRTFLVSNDDGLHFLWQRIRVEIKQDNIPLSLHYQFVTQQFWTSKFIAIQGLSAAYTIKIK